MRGRSLEQTAGDFGRLQTTQMEGPSGQNSSYPTSLFTHNTLPVLTGAQESKMTTRSQTSLLKLPTLVAGIERNRATAHDRVRRLAFMLLVYTQSAGPGGSSPTDDYGEQVLQDELDRAIGFLQSLLDEQQAALEGADDSSGPGGSGEGSDRPCGGDLEFYQAAVMANDKVAAKRYWDAYTACMRTHGTSHPKLGRPASP